MVDATSKIRKLFNLSEPYDYKGTKIQQNMPYILYYLTKWDSTAAILRGMHILLGVFSVLFSLLAAAEISEQNVIWPKIYALIAALSIGLMTAFDMGTKSNNVRTAWRKLNTCIMKYNNNVAKEGDIITCYEEAEKTIGDVVFQNK